MPSNPAARTTQAMWQRYVAGQQGQGGGGASTSANKAWATEIPDFSELAASLAEALGWGEAKELSKELLERAVGELEGSKKYATGLLERLNQNPWLAVINRAVGQLADPKSDLASSQMARLRTGLREQMRGLGDNAAAAGIATSQANMREAMQSTTDRMAALPAQNLQLAGEMAQRAYSPWATANVGATQLMMQPSSQIASILAGTEVADLSGMTNALAQIVGAAATNFYPDFLFGSDEQGLRNPLWFYTGD